jgi:hypothetical protein
VQIPDRERGDVGAAQTDLQADRKNRDLATVSDEAFFE